MTSASWACWRSAALVDVFALATFAIVGVLVYFLLHPADDFLRIAFWQMFLSVLIARLVVTAAGLILAPLRPDLRLPSITSATARVLFHRLIFLTALLAIGHTIFVLFQFAGVPEPLVLLTGTIVQWIVVIVLIAFIWLERHAIAQLLGLHAGSPGAYPTEARLGRIGAFFAGTWHVFVSAVFIGMGLFATTSRLLTAQSQGPRIIATLLLVAALPAVDGLLRMTVRRLIPPAREADDGSAENDYLPVIMRNLRIALGVLAVILFVDIWDIRIDALMPRSMGPNAASAIFDIAITLILASAFWGVIKTSINRLVPEEDLDLHAIADGEGAGTGFSRLQTLLPILRKFVFVTLVVIVGMIVVSSLGVDIGPLLAGAGVVGIAIGFGAQTLVRDIVSGIFFLIDDAFRVGEYIDVGVAKGTVERISIRSLRLRHHLGQINTIPFGEFKHVTNFSRDWVIMKLELRVPLDTDLEKVRKLVKRVGQEMLADPELGPDLLQPLKSQGVHRMEPSAFVVRVKFMAKPGEQFVLRREVFRRLHEVFQENGIRLGVSPTVVDGPPTLAGGGATSAGSEPVAPTERLRRQRRASAGRPVEHHDLGEEGELLAHRPEPGLGEQRAQVAVGVIAVERLVEPAREGRQQTVPRRAIAHLQRIHQHQPSARAQHAGELPRDSGPHLRWHLVQQVDAGDQVERAVGHRQFLRQPAHQRQPRPRTQLAPGLGKIVRAEVEAHRAHVGHVVEQSFQEAAGAAGHIEMGERGATVVAAGKRADRHQRLTAHRLGRADEQHFDLMVVEPRRALAEIAVGLVVEVTQVVVGQAAQPR